MNSRYWLVKAPDDTALTETIMSILSSCKNDRGVEVVEIVPEKRDGSWMEKAIAKRYCQEHPNAE